AQQSGGGVPPGWQGFDFGGAAGGPGGGGFDFRDFGGGGGAGGGAEGFSSFFEMLFGSAGARARRSPFGDVSGGGGVGGGGAGPALPRRGQRSPHLAARRPLGGGAGGRGRGRDAGGEGAGEDSRRLLHRAQDPAARARFAAAGAGTAGARARRPPRRDQGGGA